jgi:hypothetical protein
MKINSISELKHFPFNTHVNFVKAYENDEITLSVDRGVARQWAMKSTDSPGWLKIVAFVLTFSPYLISILTITLLILTNNWIWLITIPFIFFEVDILNPGSIVRYGIKQLLLKILIIVVVIISLILLSEGFIIVSFAILFQWICIISVYSGSASYLLWKGIIKESTVIQLWQGNALQIFTKNGDTFTKTYCELDGKYIRYDEN